MIEGAKITMLETEQVATNRGPVTYKRGETYEVEKWIADSLVGRGRAVFTDAQPVDMTPVAVVFDLALLETMNVAELRDQAQAFGLEGAKTLKKEALKSVITDYVVKVRGDAKEPPQSFQSVDVTEGKKPPEFVA